MSLQEEEKMTLEFYNSQMSEAYWAGQLICNALSNPKLHGYFTAPYYESFLVEEHPDGSIYVDPIMYRSCRIVDTHGSYGVKVELEQFISNFYMPKLITF